MYQFIYNSGNQLLQCVLNAPFEEAQRIIFTGRTRKMYALHHHNDSSE